MRSFNIITGIFLCIIIWCGCTNLDDENSSKVINAKTLTGINTPVLDSIFSDKNLLLKNHSMDTLLVVIGSEQDILKVCSSPVNLQVDFTNYTIVGCKVKSASISDVISNAVLIDNATQYQCEVTVERYTGCWAAIGNLYTWRVYPKISKEKNINMVVK